MQAPPNRNLVGMAEVADLLGLSRQRADQLSRTTGFPPAVRLVLPLDDITRQAMIDLEAEGGFPQGGAPRSYDEIVARAYTLPENPRLWRAEEIERWAAETGRRDI